MKIDKKAFADRLRATLKQEGIDASAVELARLLELEGESVSQQAISYWLNGKHRPRPAHLEALAKILGVEPHTLEYRTTKPKGVRDINTAWPDGESVSQQAISYWLNGKHRPRPAHLEALAKILGVEPHTLEYRTTKPKGVRDINTAWPDHVRGHDRLAFENYLLLPEEKRKLVRELIVELGKVAPDRGR